MTRRNPRKNGIDCLALKQRCQQRFRARTRRMTDRQLIAFLQQTVSAGPFARVWDAARSRPPRDRRTTAG